MNWTETNYGNFTEYTASAKGKHAVVSVEVGAGLVAWSVGCNLHFPSDFGEEPTVEEAKRKCEELMR